MRWEGHIVTLVVLVVIGFSCATATTNVNTSSLSGCQVCAADGDCAHAYLDGPGRFCGNWLDQHSQRQRCCCPLDATCAVSSYACSCARDPTTTPSGDVPLWACVVLTVTVLFAAAGLVACCCWCCGRPEPQSRIEGIMYPYGTAAPVYAVPGVSYGAPGVIYARETDYDAGTSATLGVGVGLLGGMLVGEALADAGDSGFDGGDNGFDSGGGGDFGGDF